jgi:hypothetical protein
VSVDSSSGYNEIIWNKPSIDLIDSFFVYKEGTTAGVYNKIGGIKASDYSVFIDSTSNPQQRADRYKITRQDSCGIETYSTAHKTIHLSINQGVGNTFNLIWDTYEGFTYGTYYILRGSSPNNLVTIDSVQSSLTSYTDLNPPPGAVNYAIEVRTPNNCNPTARSSSVTYGSSRSNVKDNLSVGISEIVNPISFSIWPNPSHENMTIEFDLRQQNKVEVGVYDMTGRLVRVLKNELLSAGKNQIEWNLSGENARLENGVYLISFTYDGITQMRRFVVM